MSTIRTTAHLLLWGLLTGCAAAATSAGSTPSAASTPPPPPSSDVVRTAAARPADVRSVDAIIATLYDVISGPAGPREWDRMRSLFTPEGRLQAVRHPPDAPPSIATFTVDGYIERNDPFFRANGFVEREIARTMQRFGGIAHVWSTYEGIVTPAAGERQTIRGINSIQLFWDGTRWWINSVYWDAERADQPLPREYLPPGS